MKKIAAKKAKDITKHFDLIEEFQPTLDDELAPADYLNALMDIDYYYDAVVFLAHALPVREAVWWACVCSRYHAQGAEAKYQLSLKAAESWAYEPSEENRQICKKFTVESEFATPASCAAAAAFWSGGNINAKDKPAMEPVPYTYAHAVTSAIAMAAGYGTPEENEVEKRYRVYLQHGINIANGGNG